MNDQGKNERLMDYLFDEMSDQQKKKFEKQLDNDPELRKELEELRSTRALIQNVPLETPPYKLVMMTPERDQNNSKGKSSGKKVFTRFPGLATVLAAAACVLIILTGSALLDLNIGQTEQGFYLTFGETPTPQTEPVQQGMSEEEVQQMMDQIREENSILLASMTEQIQEQQNEQLEEAIHVLTNYYDQRRRQDLRLISEGLAQLEEDTYYRLRQTDQTLGDLIYALSYQPTQSQQE